MSNPTTTTSDKIILNFGWKGPNTLHGGLSKEGLEVTVIDLKFKGAKTDISVHLSKDISSTTLQKFPFTCRRYQESEWEIRGQKFKPLAKETYPDSLKVTVEQIQNLTVKAGFFEKGRKSGPIIMDCSTGKITQQETVRRSDHEVKLKIPEKLESGQTYLLEISSDDKLSLSACLIKESKEKKTKEEETERKKETDSTKTTSSTSSSEDSELTKDQDELCELLGGMLLPRMRLMEVECTMKLLSSSSTNDVNLDLGNKTLGEAAIRKSVKEIDKKILKELMRKIRSLKAEGKNKSLSERSVLEKQAFTASVNVLGFNGLTKIKRSNLEALIQGTITQRVQDVINEISDRFKVIEEETPVIEEETLKDSQFTKDQAELCEILGGVLLPKMGLKVIEFSVRHIRDMTCTFTAMEKEIKKNEALGKQAIQNEIKKINEKKLKELMAKLRAIKVEWKNERSMLERQAFMGVFTILGMDGLANMMRSNLQALMQGNSNLTVQRAIDAIAVEFKMACLKEIF